MAFRISTKKHERIITRKITKTYCYVTGYFYVTASLRIFKKRKVRTPDVQQMSTRNDIYILIGGYNEMLFSETREHPCAYVNRKRTINTIHIFNMDDISINLNRE